MHRYLVCSDIHGKIANFRYALKEASMDGLDGVLIAGDVEVQVNVFEQIIEEMAPGAALYIVKGNCDYDISGLNMIETIKLPGGITCLLTHGHKYSVKSDLFTLSTVAQNLRANLVIYGHTHNFDDCKIGQVRYLNPGALYGSAYSYPSYVLLTINNGQLDILHRLIK